MKIKTIALSLIVCGLSAQTFSNDSELIQVVQAVQETSAEVQAETEAQLIMKKKLVSEQAATEETEVAQVVVQEEAEQN